MNQPVETATLEERVGAASRSTLRVGFVSFTDPARADAMASMPYRMAEILRPRVASLVTFSPEGGSGLRRQPKLWSRQPIVGRIIRHVQWRFLTFDWSIRRLEHHYPRRLYRRTLRKAEQLSRWIGGEIDRHELDVVFGCIVTWPLYHLPVNLPTVFYTDATTTVVNATYPRFSDRCQGFKQACREIEDSVFAQASALGVPADRILDSAIDDHHLSPARGHVVPMGANVLPEQPLSDTSGLSVPSRDDLRLCIVASDPHRKRTDFAIEVTEQLAARGWTVRLTVIGPETARGAASPAVDCLGRLSLSRPDHLARFREVLASSHLMILPSLGEGAAIAPAEMAHFGRPSIVSDVAGLPTVVRDNETGVVMPLAAEPTAYTHAIEALVTDQPRYQAMCAAALQRAQSVLSWDAWGDRLVELLEAAVESR